MQNYADFRKSIRDFLLLNPSPSPADTVAILERLEKQVFGICSSLGSKMDEKNNDLIKPLKERIDLGDQLNITKESTNKIIKCYNMSMKAASHTIARTIIKMIARGHAQEIYSSVEKLMNQFRLEKNLHKKNFVPTNDVLKHLWSRSKATDIVTSLTHPKFGSFSDKIEHIETSFINLYHTLSEVIHNSSPPYEDDKLPIPDLSEGQFSRSDALALASFYKIALPNIEYEFITNIVHFSSDSANLFNRIDLNNSMNMWTTTMNGTNEQSLKRKLSDGNQENEIQ
ncbi:unnamed protein product [Rotaria sp. Silwood1]|nr:unnamed protein product [Rotaria sp. Silwood1]